MDRHTTRPDLSAKEWLTLLIAILTNSQKEIPRLKT